MTQQYKCMLATTCKVAGQAAYCSELCYGFRYFHGANGEAGIWGAASIPKAYGRIRLGDLPFKKENPTAFELVRDYGENVLEHVKQGRGLYLYSIPDPRNPKGTGNGKTTAAVVILNEFLVARVAEHVRDIRRVDDVPGLFVNMASSRTFLTASSEAPRGCRRRRAPGITKGKTS